MAASEQTSAIHRFCRLPTPSYEKIYADANNILDDIISQCHTYRRPNQDISLDVSNVKDFRICAKKVL